MTIQLLHYYNGQAPGVYTLAGAEETRLIGLGLARAYTAGMDGQNPVFSVAEQAAIRGAVPGSGFARIIYVKNTASSKADDNTAEADLASFVIPAGTVGANDSIRITHMWQYPSSATTKNIKIVIGGVTALSFGATTTQKFQGIEIGRCRGSTSSQIWANEQLPFQTRTAAALATAIDFTVANTLRVVGSWGTAGVGSNLITLESVIVEVMAAPSNA